MSKQIINNDPYKQFDAKTSTINPYAQFDTSAVKPYHDPSIDNVSSGMHNAVKGTIQTALEQTYNDYAKGFSQPGQKLNEAIGEFSKGDIGSGIADVGNSIVSLFGSALSPFTTPLQKIEGTLPDSIKNLGMSKNVASTINYNLNNPTYTPKELINELVDKLPDHIPVPTSSGRINYITKDEFKNLGLPSEVAKKVSEAGDNINNLLVQTLIGKAAEMALPEQFKPLYNPQERLNPSLEAQRLANEEKANSDIASQEKVLPTLPKEELKPAYKNLDTGEISSGNKGGTHSELALSLAEQKTVRPSPTTIKQTVKGLEKGYVDSNGNYMPAGKNGLPLDVSMPPNTISEGISQQYKADWEIPVESKTLEVQDETTNKITDGVAKIVGDDQAKKLVAPAKASLLNRMYNYIKSESVREMLKQILVQKRDAVDNISYNRGEQIGNEFRATFKNEMDRKALFAIVDASAKTGGQVSLDALKGELPKVAGTEHEVAYQYAVDNFDRLSPHSNLVKAVTESQLARENSFGIMTDETEGYVPRLFEDANPIDDPFPLHGKEGSRYYLRSRDFVTAGDAIKAGKKLVSMDIADALQNRIRNGELNIQQRMYMEGLKDINDTKTGMPLVGVKYEPAYQDVKTGKIYDTKAEIGDNEATKGYTDGNGKFYKDKPVNAINVGRDGLTNAPKGYTPVKMFNRQTIYVHNGYARLMQALMADDHVKASPIGNMVLEAEGTLKHGTLGLDTFHLGRMAQLAVGVLGHINYKRGLSVLEYDMPTLKMLKNTGELSEEAYNTALEFKPKADQLIKGGLNIGKNMENMEIGLVQNTPGLKQFNNFTFQKFTRGLMLETGIKFLDRNTKLYGDVMSKADILSKSIKETNVYFGNLGRQGIFKNPTWQSSARIIALAPNWFESTIRRELMGYKQMAVDVPKSVFNGHGIKIGNIAKGLGNITMGYVAANQVINYVTRGHSTFENKEDGHMFDAWIPGGKEGEGYWISPISVTYENTHDMMRYMEMGNGAMESAVRIARNKLSPVGRAIDVEWERRNWQGKKLQGMDVHLEAARSLDPTPLALRGISPLYANSDLERQLMASGSVKITPIYALGKSSAGKEAMKLLDQRGEFYTTPEQDMQYQFIHKYVDKLKKGKVTQDDIDEGNKLGVFTDKNVKNMQQQLEHTPLQLAFKKLTAIEAARVWKKMTPQERALSEDDYETKLDNAEKAGQDMSKIYGNQ